MLRSQRLLVVSCMLVIQGCASVTDDNWLQQQPPFVSERDMHGLVVAVDLTGFYMIRDTATSDFLIYKGDAGSDKIAVVDTKTLEKLLQYSSLRSVSLVGATLDNADFTVVKSLQVQHFDISKSELTEAEFSSICDCQSIKSLNLSGVNLNRSRLEMLSQLPELENLTIIGNELNKEDARVLSTFPKLVKICYLAQGPPAISGNIENKNGVHIELVYTPSESGVI